MLNIWRQGLTVTGLYFHVAKLSRLHMLRDFFRGFCLTVDNKYKTFTRQQGYKSLLFWRISAVPFFRYINEATKYNISAFFQVYITNFWYNYKYGTIQLNLKSKISIDKPWIFDLQLDRVTAPKSGRRRAYMYI